jgi:hypothetical protein
MAKLIPVTRSKSGPIIVFVHGYMPPLPNPTVDGPDANYYKRLLRDCALPGSVYCRRALESAPLVGTSKCTTPDGFFMM